MSTLNYGKNRNVLAPPTWTSMVPEREYHAASRSGRFVSSGMLREFRHCPAGYQAIVQGLTAPRDTDAFRIGKAIHTRLLEGEEAYRTAFSIGGPVNERTGRSFAHSSKAFGEWLLETGLDGGRILTEREAETIDRICAVFRSHPEVAPLFAEGWPERTVRSTMEGIDCQARLDWLRPDGRVVDVKTVEDLGRFETDARRFGYLNQFAFYRDGIQAAGGGAVAMLAAVVEKKPPYRVGVWNFSAAVLEPYSAQNRHALIALRRCRESNRWPTGYETARTFPPAGLPPVWLN
ncbi:MAG: PD-(D/E)XK nuclease-like domain-containing protein [Planctomycetes bacterium]|nr:PD-(D/E)XK nuclease-like domain-containing protein [Planctomycetota bacterium]